MTGLWNPTRFRQPGSAAMAFMNTLVPTEARLSARARRARRPCRARAMPRQAKTSAAASGMRLSRAATTGTWRAVSAHAVLGGEADRRGGRGQDAQADGGVAQPQARPVRREPAGGHGANAGERTVRARTHRAVL